MNTFYDCISKGLKLNLSTEAVQNMGLMHFARIVFENVGDAQIPAQVYDAERSKALVLSKAGLGHAAIKQWILKVHTGEGHLHKDPVDWYRVYPHLLKGLALRFLYYHRKPHRIMCKYVMAHLFAEVFCCRIGFPSSSSSTKEEGDINWIYPLDSEDYYIDMAIKSVVIQQSAKGGSFELIQQEEYQQVACLMVPVKIESEVVVDEEPTSFTLRRYSPDGNVNIQIGRFKPVENATHLHVILHQPHNQADVIYQVYPGDENKTYYTLPSGCALFVYRIFATPTTSGGKLHFTPLAHTASHDEYLYFPLPPQDTRGVLAVCARTLQIAEDMILKHTSYEGHNKG